MKDTDDTDTEQQGDGETDGEVGEIDARKPNSGLLSVNLGGMDTDEMIDQSRSVRPENGTEADSEPDQQAYSQPQTHGEQEPSPVPGSRRPASSADEKEREAVRPNPAPGTPQRYLPGRAADGRLYLPDESETPVHSVLLRGNDWTYPTVKLAAAFRQFFEQAPETKRVFQPRKAVKRVDMGELTIDQYPRDKEGVEDVLRFVGSWPIRDCYWPTGEASYRFVNPQAVDSYLTPDFDIECECGVKAMDTDSDSENRLRGISDESHNPGCQHQWRHEMMQRLYDTRRDIAEQGLQFGHPFRQIAARVGLRSTSGWYDNIGVREEECRHLGSLRMANTAAELLKQWSPEEIAAAYGVSAAKIRRTVESKTDVSVKQRYHRRRANELAAEAEAE